MRGRNRTDSFIYRYRWRLFFSLLALIFAIPLLIYVSSPVFHAVGLHDMASAGDNMRAASDGQEAAMGSTAASAAAGAAAAGSGSGSENGRGKDDDALAPLTPSSGGEDDLAPLTPSSGADAGTGTDAGSGKDTSTSTDDGKSAWDSFTETVGNAADAVKEAAGNAKDWVSEQVSNEPTGDVSPSTSLDPETSKPPSYDDHEWGTGPNTDKGSGSGSKSDGGSSSGSSTDSGSSGSSGKGSGSGSSGKGSMTNENNTDMFGLPDWL
ncbi:hypothetical protein MCP_0948 [Methanocella paludicola SANAE]|uniref:Uncharacterized protein n=1 Tax=Methanocella paludicola (strain DSM 17711 / JCM 13418 / NBRC 101707 / SANAE) TaxID=304371 RepID=D1YX48_METPS|nr:hypothetical protein MCP_0948 [Methanocella paludicola SANAE]